MLQLQDGHGTGNRLQIDDHGRAYVNANVTSHAQHHTTYHENTFILHYTTTLTGTTDNFVGIFQNTDHSSYFELYELSISVEADTIVTLKRGGTIYTSGGVAVEPLNAMIGSGKKITPICYEGGPASNLLLTETSFSSSLFIQYMSGYSTTSYPIEGYLAVKNDNSFYFLASGTATKKVSITAVVAPHDVGTRL